MLRWSKSCRLLFIFVFYSVYCMLNFYYNLPDNLPFKRHNLKTISKFKKEQKHLLLYVEFILNKIVQSS